MHRNFFGTPARPPRRGSRFLKSLSVLATSAVAILAIAVLKSSPITVNAQTSATQGSLQVLDPNGKPRGLCPLKQALRVPMREPKTLTGTAMLERLERRPLP